MDKIKEAFLNVRKDIDNIYNEIFSLKNELTDLNKEMIKLCDLIINLNKKNSVLFNEENQKKSKTEPIKDKEIPTQNSENKTFETHPSTHNLPLEALKPQNLAFSTGNEGVPTDRQTDRQTDRHIEKQGEKSIFNENFKEKEKNDPDVSFKQDPLNEIDNAAKILDSLDNIKKEIRIKFKKLTDQEMAVFSLLYSLDQEKNIVNYKILAEKLNLTESSIRDYMGRIIKKGIPITKNKINNKTINLSIPNNLKKIATLSTILKLREI